MVPDDESERRGASTVERWVGTALDLSQIPGNVVATVGEELQQGLAGATPDPSQIEAALGDLSVPESDDLNPDATVREGAALPTEQVDTVVETGERAAEVAVEGSGEAATVLVDTGGEVVEVAVDGGEAAAEVTAKVVVAALDGL
ncbi:hypothetical protein [Haloarcula halophila]|uniref:hypothetical protein n=1 Tax=Haloarcula TaxID=2237 RepID=UPI0023E45B13|nr:hypothetical protein [Halomicroarcula sp. DFY41]